MFSIFSAEIFDNPLDAPPEQDQNYDTNHWTKLKFRVFEGQNVQGIINFKPIKVHIKNLVSTAYESSLPLSDYSFITKKHLESLEGVTADIRSEIMETNKVKVEESKKIRQKEKELRDEEAKNMWLRKQLKELFSQMNDLRS